MSRIAIGVIGAGRWGPNVIRAFSDLSGSEVRMVADQDTKRLGAIKSRCPYLHVTQSAAEAFNSPELQALAICTPTATHFDLVRQALNAGKHVFVEKPLATTTQECDELIQIAREKRRVLFVGHIFVYNSGIQAVQRFLKSGELGKVHYVLMNRTNLGPVRTDVNVLWDLAPHDLSILHYWFGSKPVAVSATGARFLGSQEDIAFITCRFPKGLLANLHVSWLSPRKIREIVLVGEKKMLTWNDMNLQSPVRIDDKSVSFDRAEPQLIADTFVSFRAQIHEGDAWIPKIQLNEPLKAECEAFLDALRDPASCLTLGESGRDVVSVLEAAICSMREHGKEIQVS